MKKSLKAIFGLMLLSLILASTVRAAVVVSYHSQNKCHNYRVTSEARPITSNESMILNKEVYGLATQNQEIDFLNQKVHVDLMALVVMGFNKKVTAEKISISSTHQDFNVFTNLLNRKLYLLEEVCLTKNNEVVSFKMFETESGK